MAVATETLAERAVRPWSETRVLFTGGSHGTGLAAAIELHRLRAEVILGSRSHQRYTEALDEFRKQIPTFDGERVSPFIADLSQPENAIISFKGLVDKGKTPTDIVHASAGGMESFLSKLGLGLVRLRRTQEKDPEAFEAQREALQSQIKENVAASMPAASAVNFEGPSYFFESIKGKLPDKAFLVNYSSLWSSFLKNVPGFYEGIATTKHMFELWMQDAAPRFARRGGTLVIISGGIIMDADVGKAISRFVIPLLPKEEQAKIEEYSIRKFDMVDATVSILRGGSFGPVQNIRRLYVYGENGQVQINETLTADHPMFDIKMPI